MDMERMHRARLGEIFILAKFNNIMLFRRLILNCYKCEVTIVGLRRARKVNVGAPC